MAERRLLGGRYELDGILGRGGMAEVYRARDVRLGRVVAVKMLRHDLTDDPAAQERFHREAQSAASLNHPSIIAVYDTGEDTAGEVPVPFIVMEYSDGRTLADLLGEDRRLLPSRSLEIIAGVLLALDQSHRKGIVHRDIKPSNVMVTRQGAVKVMDFGIARSLTGSQATITQTAQVIGTAQYMSPEQVRGEQADARSDLYSAGCLLYELLTGRPPFVGQSAVAVAYQHVRENPVPPSHLVPQIPPWADGVVLKAMAKIPADRYQHADDMLADIQRAVSGVPVSQPPPARVPSQTPWPGGAAVQAPPVQPPPAQPPPAQPPPASAIPGHGGAAGRPPRHRRRAVLWTVAGVLTLAAIGVAAYLVLASGNAKAYPVPDVRGLTTQQAGQKITASHLRPHFISQGSTSVLKGQVISTRPAGGTVVAAGSTVTVFVSAGQHQRPVPDVLGKDVAAARAAIVKAGLNPVVKSDTKATAPAGTVARQSPVAGTVVNPGSVVTMYVSPGGATSPGGTPSSGASTPPRGIAVRDVIGDPAATAKSILHGQGFRVTEVTGPGHTSVPAGDVDNQQPAGGTLLAPGATVTISVQPAAAPPTIVVTPTALAVTQNSTGTFSVQLSAAPASTTTLTVGFTAGDSGLTVTSGDTLTFTTDDWNAAQEVTITADSTSTGTATFTASSSGYPPATITVTETPATTGSG
jgi:eukaryotic-like serine/threonine-protein kinase